MHGLRSQDLSNNWPPVLSKTNPTRSINDYAHVLNPQETHALTALAQTLHYKVQVVLLPPTYNPQNTRKLALEIGKTWRMGPNGFLIVVNTHAHQAAMVSGKALSAAGIDNAFILSKSMSNRFRLAHTSSDLYKSLHDTMLGVESACQSARRQSEIAHHTITHNSTDLPPLMMMTLVVIAVSLLLTLIAIILHAIRWPERSKRTTKGNERPRARTIGQIPTSEDNKSLDLSNPVQNIEDSTAQNQSDALKTLAPDLDALPVSSPDVVKQTREPVGCPKCGAAAVENFSFCLKCGQMRI